jgi:hypothetical protein
MADIFEIDMRPTIRFARLLKTEMPKLFNPASAVDAAARRGVEIMRSLIDEEGAGIVWEHEFRTLRTEEGKLYLMPAPAEWSRGPAGHRSSAPYDPPSSYTGALERGIMWQRGPRDKVNATARVQVAANEAKLRSLEFGARAHPGELAPRPFVRPAMDQTRREIRGIYSREMRKATGKAARQHRLMVRRIFKKKK